MNSRTNYWIAQTNVAVLMLTIVFIMTAIIFLGCNSPQIRENLRIPLIADQQSEGVSKTMDYIFDYQIVYQQAKADGTGKIKLSGKVTPNKNLKSLTINLNFIDADGKILENKLFYPPLTGLGVAIASIQETYDTPAGTVGITFTHHARQRPIWD